MPSIRSYPDYLSYLYSLRDDFKCDKINFPGRNICIWWKGKEVDLKGMCAMLQPRRFEVIVGRLHVEGGDEEGDDLDLGELADSIVQGWEGCLPEALVFVGEEGESVGLGKLVALLKGKLAESQARAFGIVKRRNSGELSQFVDHYIHGEGRDIYTRDEITELEGFGITAILPDAQLSEDLELLEASGKCDGARIKRRLLQ